MKDELIIYATEMIAACERFEEFIKVIGADKAAEIMSEWKTDPALQQLKERVEKLNGIDLL